MMLSRTNKKHENILDVLLNFIEKYYYLFLSIVLIVAIFNLFYNLNVMPINNWDEARHGVNAYEMLKNKEFIVNTFEYKNDYYNLKPPLSYWTIMLGYKIVDFSPLGLRVFSAISALLTIIITAVFVKYKHGKISSLISAAVLTTSVQYIKTLCKNRRCRLPVCIFVYCCYDFNVLD
jgi:4-amino-4-deoxy-L-arabinose transferase-like glycosyltransferase